MHKVGKISVYVEDELTKEYLNTIWSDSLSIIGVVCAGNITAVRNIVAYDNANNNKCFGIVDRDFRWTDSDNEDNTFTLKKHEIENYLLDEAAIHASRFNSRHLKTKDSIYQTMIDFVNSNKYWFACCYLIHKLDGLVYKGFPRHPSITSIPTVQAITEYINSNDYYNGVVTRLQIINPESIQSYVSDVLTEIEQHYTSNKQLSYFPGKEVFSNIRGYLSGSNYADSKTMNTDLAKEIGEYQISHKSVPKELEGIKTTILKST